MDLYEYATIRLVPDMEREEFVNIGLIMMCKRKRWVQIKFNIRQELLTHLWPAININTITANLDSLAGICNGRTEYGPIATLEPEERFRWITAVKSAVIQTSRPHPGLTDSLEGTFEQLLSRLV